MKNFHKITDVFSLNKKTSKIALVQVIAFLLLVFMPIMEVLAWNTSNVKISDLGIENGQIKQFKLSFAVPSLGAATCRICLQSKTFNSDDLTDFGNVVSTYNFSNVSQVNSNSGFKSTYGIEGFSDNEFPCFGTNTNINNQNVSGLNIDINQSNKTYYIYLWTTYTGKFYPDALLGTININNGTITVKDSAGNNGIVVMDNVTVTFNSNGGSAVTSQTVTSGGKATRPTNPTKTNYAFVNWYENSNLSGNPFDFNTAITANKTLYAKWKPVISKSSSGYTGNYDGNEHGINVSVTFPTSGVTIKYKTTSSGTYTLTSSPKYTNVGTYTVYYQISASNADNVEGSETVTINEVNKSALNSTIDNATDFYNSIKDNYPTIANTLNTEINNAKSVKNNQNVTAAQVESAKNALNTALTTAQTAYDNAKAKEVDDLIDAIGTIEATAECSAKITAARTAYNNLTPAQKALVTKLKELTDAESAYSVVNEINSIGTVEYTDESKTKITNARANYDNLTDDQKDLVTNLKTLTDDEAEYERLRIGNEAAKPIVEKINAIGYVEYNGQCLLAIEDARKAYNALPDVYKPFVHNYDVLLGAEEAYEVLRGDNNLIIVSISTDQVVKGKVNEDLVIVTSGDLNKLTSISINGAVLDPRNYGLAKGSTILTLKKEYLATLAHGNYTVSFAYNTGKTVEAKFFVDNNGNGRNPKTADNIAFWISLSGISIVGIVVTIVVLKKQKLMK